MTSDPRLRMILKFSVAGMLLLSLATALARRPIVIEQPVVLDLRTRLYHCPVCGAVKQCGSGCRTVDLSEAVRLGGRPCAACGGTCPARE